MCIPFSQLDSQPPGRIQRNLRRLAVLPILGYRKILSPLLPPSCIYHPSCSEYTRQSILRFGLLRGTLLGTARILRCSGLFTGGHDPVPGEFSWRKIRRDYRDFRPPRRKHRTDKTKEGD